MTRPKILGAVISVVGACALALAVLANTAPAQPSPTPEQAYSVLTRRATAADAPDATIQALATASPNGLLAADARVLRTVADTRLWIIPGDGVTCLIAESTTDTTVRAATSCANNTDAATKGVGLGLGGTIYGLAPDSATSVAVTSSGATTSTTPVVDNVYVIDQSSTAWTVETADGPESFSISR